MLRPWSGGRSRRTVRDETRRLRGPWVEKNLGGLEEERGEWGEGGRQESVEREGVEEQEKTWRVVTEGNSGLRWVMVGDRRGSGLWVTVGDIPGSEGRNREWDVLGGKNRDGSRPGERVTVGLAG